jgi:hypothetical protein
VLTESTFPSERLLVWCVLHGASMRLEVSPMPSSLVARGSRAGVMNRPSPPSFIRVGEQRSELHDCCNTRPFGRISL